MKELKVKKYLGIDHGDSRIGLSFADDDTKLAVPYDLLDGHDSVAAIEAIRSVCLDEDIDEIIVGMPFAKQGGSTSQQQKVKRFIKKLSQTVSLPIIEEDERFSTRMADKLNPKADDSVAAAIILQTYLDKVFFLA